MSDDAPKDVVEHDVDIGGLTNGTSSIAQAQRTWATQSPDDILRDIQGLAVQMNAYAQQPQPNVLVIPQSSAERIRDLGYGHLIIDDPYAPAMGAEPDLIRFWGQPVLARRLGETDAELRERVTSNWPTPSREGARDAAKCRAHDWAWVPSVHGTPTVRLAGQVLRRQGLGRLAARYGTYGKARPNRRDARRWIREFAPVASVAEDALLEGRRADALRVLVSMVSIDDAVELVEPRPRWPRVRHNALLDTGRVSYNTPPMMNIPR